MHCDRYRRVEGLQDTRKPGSQWGLILATFFLTVCHLGLSFGRLTNSIQVIYLPLSTIAVHVLVWSQDLWIVPNPYLNATSLPPVVPPLGPAAEFRDSLDFCWTSTMRKNEINFAPVVIVLAAVVVLTVSNRYISRSCPSSTNLSQAYTLVPHRSSKGDQIVSSQSGCIYRAWTA